jgi:hypothetical protein
MIRLFIILSALVFSASSHAKLEPELIDWTRTDLYVVDITKLDIYVIAHLLHDAEVEMTETITLPPTEEFYVLNKIFDKLPARTIPFRAHNHDIYVPVVALQSEMLERLIQVDDFRLQNLIEAAIAKNQYDIPLHTVLFKPLTADEIAQADVFAPRTSFDVPGSNSDNVTIPIHFLLSDMHTSVARIKIAKSIMKMEDREYLFLQSYYPLTPARERMRTATNIFIAYTALHSKADGFRIDLAKFIISGKARLETRVLLVEELQRQLKEELFHPRLQLSSRSFAWMRKTVEGFLAVEGAHVTAARLNPDDRLQTDQAQIDELYGKSFLARVQARGRMQAQTSVADRAKQIAAVIVGLAAVDQGDCNSEFEKN